MPASTNDKRGLDRSLLVTEQTIEPGFGAVDMFDDCSGKQSAYRGGTGVPWSRSITVTSTSS